MQDWQKKIFDGMTMIKEGCTAAEATRTANCKECPFFKYCDCKLVSDEPQSWQVER